MGGIINTSDILPNLERSMSGRDILCAANIINQDVHKETSAIFDSLSRVVRNENLSTPEDLRHLLAQARCAIVRLEIYHTCSHTVDIYVKEELEKISKVNVPIFYTEDDFPDIIFDDFFGYWQGLSDDEQQIIFHRLANEKKREKTNV